MIPSVRFIDSEGLHQSPLNKAAPVPRAVHSVGRVLPTPILGGLHHQYVRI